MQNFFPGCSPVSWISVCFGANTMLAQILHVCLITRTTCIYKAKERDCSGWLVGEAVIFCSSHREPPYQKRVLGSLSELPRPQKKEAP